MTRVERQMIYMYIKCKQGKVKGRDSKRHRSTDIFLKHPIEHLSHPACRPLVRGALSRGNGWQEMEVVTQGNIDRKNGRALNIFIDGGKEPVGREREAEAAGRAGDTG